MCLLVVASRVVAEEPLIVGANRDEILERPATSVTVLDEGPPRILGGRDELSGGTWLAVNEHGAVCRADEPAAGRRQGPVQALARRAAARAGPPRDGARGGRGPPAGLRPAGLQRLVVAGGRSHLALLRRLHRSPARPPRSRSRPGSTSWRTVPWARPRSKVDLVREALGLPTRGRRGGGGLPPRPGRPPDPRGGRASERGQLRAPRVLRDAFVVHRPGARRHRPAAAVGGRRTPVCHAVRGDRAGCGPDTPPRARRLSRGRAACSAAGGAGRPRPRGACAGRPRSR